MAKKKGSTPIPKATLPDDISLDMGDIALGGFELELPADDNAGGSDEADLRGVDIEKIAEDEANELLAGFKERAQRETERLDWAVDTEFWIALGFQTREQKEEFLDKIGWHDLGDKYLDGMACADAVGIELTSFVPPMPHLRLDTKLMALAHNIGSAFRGGKKKKRIVIVDDDE